MNLIWTSSDPDVMPVGSPSSRPRSRHLLLLRHRRFNHDPLTPVASRMNGGTSGSGSGSLSPFFIFFLVGVLQILDGLLDFVKRKGMHSAEEVQLRKEIKQLLKEASSLSTPSTFAQSAKLRRLAAAKEKELLRKQEEHRKEKSWFYELCGRVLLVIKVLLYATLVLQFWGVPVAAVPHHLLQPFGKILSWRAGNSATGQIMVGIVPWLILTSRVSKFLWQKLSKGFLNY